MKIDRFSFEKHGETLKGWLFLRKLPQTLAEDVPEVGFWISGEEGPIAAGFIRQMEGGCAMLEGLISNPERSSMDRHEAITAIFHLLIAEARERRVKRLFAFSSDISTIKRSVEHGFLVMTEALLIQHL